MLDGVEEIEMLSTNNVEKLKTINSIERLLEFLREDLAWPLAEGDVESLTFEYEPAELGLRDEHAPKINRIYQIRSITKDQPWGIFFIDFENKKLPVTLMRRILNHLRVKNRGQAIQAWNAGDLLFMTTYGEQKENAREVAFAHFHETPGDLPTLNVIQWDRDDTPAKLKNTYDTLRNNLQWPEETTSNEEWRHQWAAPFKHKPGHVITTAKQLAEALATLSKSIRDRAKELLEAESEKGPLTKLFKAFQESLIHDLKPEDFSDTFAQTISYGLLTAAISRTDMDAGNKGTTLLTEDIANLVPVTNPFLREILETFLDVGGRKKAGMDFDELGVQDVVELLRGDATDLPAVLRDFGNQKQGEDPVIHFYEDYLKAYNKELKVKRGVFYTPKPVVSYIVRSVHELLQTEFGLEDGLASTITWGEMAAKNPEIKIPEGTDPDAHFVTILDPAAGTGTFLVEVIDVIWKLLQAKWAKSAAACWQMIGRQPSAGGSFQDFWNDYVADHLLPRLYGYELMMAPYAIAHMKLGLKLGETGYRFATDRRVRVYLTNALEPPTPVQPQLHLYWEALAREAEVVTAVKRSQRFTVVIGNPPYSIQSQNLTPESRALVDPYRVVNGVAIKEKGALQFEKYIQDDYIKFLRLSEISIAQCGVGLFSIISNHNYIDGPTFRGLRWHVASSHHRVRIVDLHGSSIKREVTPDGAPDENVFDIQQGVAIVFAIGLPATILGRDFTYSELWGPRARKYDFLSSNGLLSTEHQVVDPRSPYFLFMPQSSELRDEYGAWMSVDSLMPQSGAGVVTARDGVVIGHDSKSLVDRATRFRDSLLTDADLCASLDMPLKKGWNIRRARELIRKERSLENFVQQISYRPLDARLIFYHPSLVWGMSWPTMQHMAHDGNLGVSISRSVRGAPWRDVLASRSMIEFGYMATRPGNSAPLFPLYLLPSARDAAMGNGKVPNLSPAFLDALAGAIGRSFEYNGSSASPGGLFEGLDGAFAPVQPALDRLPTDMGPRQGDLGPFARVVTFSPEDVFHFIYAVLHSPTYRTRYAEFLKIDFARIPLPGGPEVFDALIPLGERLVALHVMEAPKPERWATTYRGPADPQVEKVTFTPGDDGLTGTVWLDKAQTRGFHGVPISTWNFHIGGYQVCEKWLKDRGPKKGKPGRTLTPEDIEHYHYIAFALTETQALMTQIDEAIEHHGGWQGAFQGDEPKHD